MATQETMMVVIKIVRKNLALHVLHHHPVSALSIMMLGYSNIIMLTSTMVKTNVNSPFLYYQLIHLSNLSTGQSI